MKMSRYINSIFVLLTILMFSFILPLKSSEFKITVSGVDHDYLNDGLKPSEFAELKIESKYDSIVIDSFQITLARGNRAIDISTVKSNKFNLRKYISYARSGDRIVIEIKKSNENNGSSLPSISVITIKVN